MIKFNIVTKLGISEVSRGDKEDMKGRTKRERAKLWRIMIFVCVLFFGMSEKVVFAEEQREQNEQHNEQQYEVDVHNRTGLEEFRFVEEIAEEAASDDVMLFALGESIHTNSIEASEAYDYWESMDSDYIYSQLSDMEQAVWDDLEALCVEYAENSEDCEKIKATICFTGMTKEDAKE